MVNDYNQSLAQRDSLVLLSPIFTWQNLNPLKPNSNSTSIFTSQTLQLHKMPSQVTVNDPSMLYFKAKPPFAYKFTHSQNNLKTSLQKFSPISSTLISPLLTMKLFSCSHFLKTLLPLTLFPPLHFIFAPLCSKIPLKNCLYIFYNSSSLILFFFSKFTANRLFSTPLSQNYS